MNKVAERHKRVIGFVLMVLIYSCGSTGQINKKIDDRPCAMKSLIRYFYKKRDYYDQLNNKILKDEFLQRVDDSLQRFIKDSIKYKVDNWPAIVESITTRDYPRKYAIVVFNIAKDKNETESYDNDITIESNVPETNDLYKILRQMSTGQSVNISGHFVPNDNGKIDYKPLGGMDYEGLVSPEFYLFPEGITLNK